MSLQRTSAALLLTALLLPLAIPAVEARLADLPVATLAPLPAPVPATPQLPLLAEPELPRLTLLAPAAGEGALPNASVPIVWHADASDFPRTGALFRVQVKSDSLVGWVDVEGGYKCSSGEDDAFHAGTCRATWVTNQTGAYSVRVLYLSNLSVPDLCVVPTTCDMAGPFYVDQTAPAVLAPCVLSGAACRPSNEPVKHATITVGAAATDDLGVARVVVTATGERGSASCESAPAAPAPSVAAAPGCAIGLAGVVNSPAPDVLSGFVTLSVKAYDAAGNLAAAAGPTYAVDTTSEPLAVTSFAARPAAAYQAGRAAVVTFKVVHGSPPSLAGQPVAGEAFEVRNSGLACSGVTSGSGLVECSITAAEGVHAFTAGVVPRPGLAGASHAFTLTWSNVVLTRVASQDAPLPTLAANVGESYSAGYAATFSHSGAPASAAAVTLRAAGGQPSTEATDAAGFVRVPVISAAAGAVTFASSGSYSAIRNAGPSVNVTWNRIATSALALDDAFVNVGDVVTLTGRAVYEHNLTPVASASLALGAGVAGCTLVEGSVTNGDLLARVRCDAVRATAVPLRVASNPVGVTSLVSPLSVAAVWTRVNLTVGTVDDAFVNAGDVVNLTTAARYDHDGSAVASGVLGLAPGAPAGCSVASSAIVAGASWLAVKCTEVVNATGVGLSVAIASTDAGVTALAEPRFLNATWTTIDVSELALHDAFVNVTSFVDVGGKARYRHDQTPVPSATLALGADAPAGCALVSGAVAAGTLTARLRCDAVRDLSATGLPLVLTSGDRGVTRLGAALAPKAVWTEVVVTNLTVDDAVVNAEDVVVVRATAQYAHDNASVPSGQVALASAPAGCQLHSGAISAGQLTARLNCTDVQDLTPATLGFTLSAASADVTRLASAVRFGAAWSRVTVTDARVDDGLVNVGDVVNLTARATYAHNGSAVRSGTVALGNATTGCSLVTGTIVDGNLTAAVRCDRAYDLSDKGLPLVVTATDEGVVNLTAPLALKAVWTRVQVAHALSTAAPTLGAGEPVLVTVKLTWEHNGANLTDGIATVERTGVEYQCLTNATGECVIELAEDLGRHQYTVSGVSTRVVDGILVPDVTSNPQRPTFEKRWTAIAFAAFECRKATLESEAVDCGQAFAKGMRVWVTATAVAADNHTEVLSGASIRLGGRDLTTNATGQASIDVVRTSPGATTLSARGMRATIDGQLIEATETRSLTIEFR